MDGHLCAEAEILSLIQDCAPEGRLMPIHATAIVHESASVHPEAEIGPYAVIGASVVIGARTRVGAHAVVEGPTVLGEGNVVHAHVALGGPPQDLKYAGEPTRLVVGSRNVFREFMTAHRGTVTGHEETVIGDDNLFMAYSHVAHDCVIGNRTVFANSASLSGTSSSRTTLSWADLSP